MFCHARGIRPLLLCALGLVLIASSGCGQSDSEEVESVLHGYLNALAARDGPRACGFLTREAQLRSFRLNRVHAAPDHPAQACASVVQDGFFPGYGFKRLRSASISAIEVDGDRAQAKADGFSVKLEKVGGEWKLAVSGIGNRVGDSPPPRKPG
jgi:hypothetical protein